MNAWQSSNGPASGQSRKPGRRVAVIAEDDQDRHGRQSRDLLVGVSVRAATRLDQHETSGRGRIEQRRFQRKRSGLRVPISTAPFSWVARSDSALIVGLGVGRPRVHVGHALLRQLIDGGHRELAVRERGARFEPKRKFGQTPSSLNRSQGGLIGRWRRSRAHVVEDGLIEARSPAPDLVGDVDGMALAHEVLVPPHSAVRRRLPGLAGQGRAVDHDHRKVAVTALRHHVPHVHLVDGDVPPGTEVAQLAFRLLDLLAADEEAALCLQHQRRVGVWTSLRTCAVTSPAVPRMAAIAAIARRAGRFDNR